MYMFFVHLWIYNIIIVYTNVPPRGDFKVMFPGSEAEFTASVFFLLENACKELANVSYQLQKRVSDGQLHGKNTLGARSIYSEFVYTRMLWSKSALLCLANRFFVDCVNRHTLYVRICHVCKITCGHMSKTCSFPRH